MLIKPYKQPGKFSTERSQIYKEIDEKKLQLDSLEHKLRVVVTNANGHKTKFVFKNLAFNDRYVGFSLIHELRENYKTLFAPGDEVRAYITPTNREKSAQLKKEIRALLVKARELWKQEQL